MADPTTLRLRDPSSYWYRAIRSPRGAALRGGTASTGPLVCTTLTLTAAHAHVTLDAATADVGLVAAHAHVDLTECE